MQQYENFTSQLLWWKFSPQYYCGICKYVDNIQEIQNNSKKMCLVEYKTKENVNHTHNSKKAFSAISNLLLNQNSRRIPVFEGHF